MRLVLDASVALASLRPAEPGHQMIAAAPKTTMTIDAALGRGRVDGIR
jgi:hypothetical protein